MVKRILIFLCAATCGAQQKADPRIGAMLSELASTHAFSDVAVSPDGKRVAWVEQGLEGKPEIFIGARVKVGEGSGIAWAPDSSRIAFFSDREKPGQKQLYTVAATGGRVKKLTSVTGFVTDARWSPDGTKIAILFAENAPGGGGPLVAEPAETGVIGGEIFNQRTTIVDANSGGMKQISPADFNIYEYDWSPDGKTFVVSAAPGPADNNWWVAKLYTMNSETGKMTEIYRPETQVAMPRFSPDGSSVGFIEGLMSDEGFTGGDVFTIPAGGGKATNQTPGRKASVSSIQWITPEKILITEFVAGPSVIGTLDVSTGVSERLWQGDENLHGGGNFGNFSASRDGKIAAAIRSDWQHPPEVWAGAMGDWKKVTGSNTSLQPKWGQAKSIEWSNDGFSAQGWLLYPRDFDASKRYPMIVSVHGGPANSNYPHWPGANFDLSVLSAFGYFVFFPNPRGSYGEGEAFTRANVKDFGYGDLKDVMAGVDAVLKQAPVDANRMGVAGWSYGGYMTMWTVTQTNRFKAAVAGAGIANWLSYYGQNSIDQWMIPYFGASVYDDPAVYAKSSPITFIKNVKTPTLVVVGERDGECPTPQSYEFWHALKTLGVPTELVVYPGEGHMFRKADHKRDVIERTIAWFEKYLQ
jgi:dipeptidyl aminopeptidase/acylaminoacyl peptidase